MKIEIENEPTPVSENVLIAMEALLERIKDTGTVSKSDVLSLESMSTGVISNKFSLNSFTDLQSSINVHSLEGYLNECVSKRESNTVAEIDIKEYYIFYGSIMNKLRYNFNFNSFAPDMFNDSLVNALKHTPILSISTGDEEDSFYSLLDKPINRYCNTISSMKNTLLELVENKVSEHRLKLALSEIELLDKDREFDLILLNTLMEEKFNLTDIGYSYKQHTVAELLDFITGSSLDNQVRKMEDDLKELILYSNNHVENYNKYLPIKDYKDINSSKISLDIYNKDLIRKFNKLKDIDKLLDDKLSLTLIKIFKALVYSKKII